MEVLGKCSDALLIDSLCIKNESAVLKQLPQTVSNFVLCFHRYLIAMLLGPHSNMSKMLWNSNLTSNLTLIMIESLSEDIICIAFLIKSLYHTLNPLFSFNKKRQLDYHAIGIQRSLSRSQMRKQQTESSHPGWTDRLQCPTWRPLWYRRWQLPHPRGGWTARWAWRCPWSPLSPRASGAGLAAGWTQRRGGPTLTSYPLSFTG